MAIYAKTAKQMLVDLINEGNPNLPFPINDSDFDFTVPEVITDPGNGHNTKIRVIAKPNTNYIGNIVVTYRRLNIGYIFRNMTLEVDRWIANTGVNSGSLLTLNELLPLYSEKYGLPFTVGEWTDRWLSGVHGIRGDAFSITPLSSNLVFVGTISARWYIGERTLDSLLPVDVVAGRLYPGGNDLDDPEHKYWVTPDSFNIDFTDKADVLNNGSLSAIPIGRYQGGQFTSAQQRFVDEVLPRVTARNHPRITEANYIAHVGNGSVGSYPADYELSGYLVRELGLTGIQPIRYTLPDARVPEANSEFFNRVLVLPMPADCPWGTGNLYFHFNV